MRSKKLKALEIVSSVLIEGKIEQFSWVCTAVRSSGQDVNDLPWSARLIIYWVDQTMIQTIQILFQSRGNRDCDWYQCWRIFWRQTVVDSSVIVIWTGSVGWCDECELNIDLLYQPRHQTPRLRFTLSITRPVEYFLLDQYPGQHCYDKLEPHSSFIIHYDQQDKADTEQSCDNCV